MCLLTSLAVLGGIETWVDGGGHWELEGEPLHRSRWDKPTRLTYRAKAAGKLPSDLFRVVMVGPSALESALPFDQKRAAEEFVAAFGHPLGYTNLTMGGRSVLDSLHLLEVSQARKGVVCLGVSALHYLRLARWPAFYFPSPAKHARRLIERLDVSGLFRSPLALRREAPWLRQWLWAALHSPWKPHAIPPYPAWPTDTIKDSDYIASQLGLRLEVSVAMTTYYWAALEALADYCDALVDLRLILVRQPLNPIVQRHLDEHESYRTQPYTSRLEEFRTRRGIAYIDVLEEANLVDSEFIDGAHLETKDARLRFTKILAAAIVETDRAAGR